MMLVDYPAENWKQMKGNTQLEQYVNGLLASNFVGNKDVPSDRCYVLAETFCNEAHTKEQIAFILFSTFDIKYMDNGEIMSFTTEDSTALINKIAKEIYRLSKAYNQYGELS